MGVNCQILINKVKEVYKPGQAVTGRVKFCVDEPTEYDNVILSFLGKGKCVWSRGAGKHRRTYRGTESYIQNLVNICNKPDGETITLRGEYEYPFEFYLPENIPRSYKDRTSSIIYYIELKLVKASFFSFNKVFTAEIPVYSYMDPIPSEGPLMCGLIKKSLFSLFAPSPPMIYLKAMIEKKCMVPGENVNLTYTVTNDSDVDIISVKTELYCSTTYTANCGSTMVVKDKVNSCDVQTNSVPGRQTITLICLLPTLPHLYSVIHSQIISKEYLVRVTVRLPLPHINATKDFPILIGEQRGRIDPCVEMVEQDGLPPSYWEAMNEADDSEENQGGK